MNASIPLLPAPPEGAQVAHVRLSLREIPGRTPWYCCQHCSGWIAGMPALADADGGWNGSCHRCGNRLAFFGMTRDPKKVVTP